MDQAPKKRLSLKQRMTIVYSVFALILIVSILSKVLKGKDSFSLEEVLAKNISSVTIKDQGLAGNKQMAIKRSDSLSTFLKLASMSKPVAFDSLHIKLDARTCQIIFEDASGRTYPMVLSDESKNKGVLRSGDYFYRNNELLLKLIEQLNTIPAAHQ